MKQRYVRVPPRRQDTVGALMASGIVAAGVGAVTFYLTRLFLAREPLGTEGHGDGTELQRGAEDGGGETLCGSDVRSC